jgi:hypothetical protein
MYHYDTYIYDNTLACMLHGHLLQDFVESI